MKTIGSFFGITQLREVIFMKRAVHLFPEFTNSEVIESLRKKYDPLFGLIQPHITIVFPFESEISSPVLKQHIQKALVDIDPFVILLREFTATIDRCLILNIKKGNDNIIKLHDLLYSGLLSIYRNRRFSFYPHLTIGKFTDEQELLLVLTELSTNETKLETTISKVVSEIIDEKENSIVEFILEL